MCEVFEGEDQYTVKFTSFLEGSRVIGMVEVIGDVCLQV
jgi:hypothetical protein